MEVRGEGEVGRKLTEPTRAHSLLPVMQSSTMQPQLETRWTQLETRSSFYSRSWGCWSDEFPEKMLCSIKLLVLTCWASVTCKPPVPLTRLYFDNRRVQDR